MKLKMLLAAALIAAFVAGPMAVAQDETPENVYSKLLAERAESVVSIKYVLRLQLSFQGQSRDQEMNNEVSGVVLSDRGLILTANSAFSPNIRNPQIEVKATPSDIRVIFAGDEEEYEARVVARDSDLDLAFLQILDLKERTVKPVDLTVEGQVAVGQELVGVTRMPRGFDSAPMVGRLFVTAKVERPRAMWAVSGDFGGMGLPVYDLSGRPVGVLAAQEGSEGVDGGGMSGMMGMGGSAPFVLPLATVARAVKAAEERAAEMLAEAAKEGAGDTAEPTDEPADEPADEPGDEPTEEPKDE